MNIILLGWNANTLFVAEKIFKSGHSLFVGIDKKRQNESIELISFCSQNKIPFSFCSKNLENIISVFDKHDALISASWPYIIKDEVLFHFRHCFNIHASLLPKYRGQHPINWAIINDDKIGVTVHKITKNLDDGEIYLQKEVPYTDVDTLIDIRQKVHSLGACLIANVLNLVENNNLIGKEQDPSGVTLAPKRSIQDGKINWKIMKSREIFNLVRSASNPGPGAFCFTSKMAKLVIWKAEEVKIVEEFNEYEAGRIVCFKNARPVVKTSDKLFLVLTDFEGANPLKGDILT